MTTPDQALEAQIQAVGADVAPRITPADIEANIVSEHYFTAADGVNATAAIPTAYEFYNPDTGHAIVDYSEHTHVGHLSRENGYVPLPLVKKWSAALTPLSLMTFCVLILKNGTKVVGVNEGPVSPENFNPKLGREYARQKAIDQVWPMMGYELRSRLTSGAGGFQAGDVASANSTGFREGYASAKRGDPEPFGHEG